MLEYEFDKGLNFATHRRILGKDDPIQDTKNHFGKIKDDLLDRLEQTGSVLSKKISRLDQIVNYSIGEAGDWSKRLMEECEKIK